MFLRARARDDNAVRKETRIVSTPRERRERRKSLPVATPPLATLHSTSTRHAVFFGTEILIFTLKHRTTPHQIHRKLLAQSHSP